MNKKKRVIFLQLLMLSGLATARTIPNAGVLQQQNEKRIKQQLPKKRMSIIPESAPLKQLPKGETMIVKSFGFSGNTLIKTPELQLTLAKYINHPISFAQLQQAVSVITEHYRKAGWMVRAYLPRQDVTDGIVTIQVVEAVFGGVEAKDGEIKRIATQQLINIINKQQKKGEFLNINQLDRALLLMDDLPGINITGSLKKGKGANETDLVLEGIDSPIFTSDISLDNFGSRSTGYEQIQANLYLQSPFKMGDLITMNLTHAEGNDYIRGAYSLPVGSNGLRIGMSGSYLHYDLVHDDFKGLSGRGDSATIGFDAKYPIIRSRAKNLFVTTHLDYKKYENEAQQTTTSAYKIISFSTGLNGNLYDGLLGGGANAAGMSFKAGNVILETIDFAENTGVAGNFVKFNYYLSRQQVITDNISFYGALSGQQSSTDLDSSEKMYLGGPFGVRAYPTNEGGGDDGQLINLELRGRLPYNFNVTSFFDWGHVVINHNNSRNAAPNSNTLKGAGLAFGWQSSFGLNLNGTWAHRIGRNKNPTATGNDQDGSYRLNQYWLQASMQF